EHASLLHISTCYVAGRRYGEIPEELASDYAPLTDDYDAEQELQVARERVAQVVAEHEAAAFKDFARDDVLAAFKQQKKPAPTEQALEKLARKYRRDKLKDALADEGMSRARHLGWPNTYTYTKSMAESLLEKRRDRLRFSILRPSIVESALEFPFPGWNESFNGTAPLAY